MFKETWGVLRIVAFFRGFWGFFKDLWGFYRIVEIVGFLRTVGAL